MAGLANLIWTLIVILVVLWLLGFLLHVGGALIHLILVVAVILLVINLLTGRGARVCSPDDLSVASPTPADTTPRVCDREKLPKEPLFPRTIEREHQVAAAIGAPAYARDLCAFNAARARIRERIYKEMIRRVGTACGVETPVADDLHLPRGEGAEQHDHRN
jgi:hypothetical protein